MLTFGLAAALVLAGLLCALLVGGVAGEVLTFVLVAAGAAWAVLLLFLEVGLSEEHELEREERRRREKQWRSLQLRRRPRVPPRRR